MKVVLQRVKEADVTVGEKVKSAISNGYVLLVGIDKDDTPGTIGIIAKKICSLRGFEDEQGKMNLDISQINGSILSVPQFTLLGSMDKGNRPGFDNAAAPDKAQCLWEKFNEDLRALGIPVYEGEFGAHMDVSLMNDGPVTFIIDSGAIKA